MNQTLIARLAAGEIAAENNGTLEQLREVLKAAFPKDIEGDPEWKYYMKNPFHCGEWVANSKVTLPTVPITDFFKSSIEDRAVELLRELSHLNLCDMEGLMPPTAMQWMEAYDKVADFLNEINKEK